MHKNSLPHIEAALEAINTSDDQKQALLYHFECLLSALASCVNAKYVGSVPNSYHNEYLKQIGENIVRNTKEYLWQVAPLGYIDEEKRESLIIALQEEVDSTTKNAQGDVLTFNDWHTVV